MVRDNQLEMPADNPAEADDEQTGSRILASGSQSVREPDLSIAQHRQRAQRGSRDDWASFGTHSGVGERTDSLSPS